MGEVSIVSFSVAQNQLSLHVGAGLRFGSRQVGGASEGGFNEGSSMGINEKSQGRSWGCAAEGKEGEQQRIC